MNLELLDNKWNGRRVLVIGDVMLDQYIFGSVDRVSPEAPVPVLCKELETNRLGGAANVAANIVALGGRASLLGYVGEDAEGQKLQTLVESFGIDNRLIKVDRSTTTKLRILGNKQQLVRVDREYVGQYKRQYTDRLQALAFNLSQDGYLLDQMDAVVISDYSKGVVTPDLIQIIRNTTKPILVDPKNTDFSFYAGVDTICPNRKEISEALDVSGIDELTQTDFISKIRLLIAECGIGQAIVKLGANGISYIGPDSDKHYPAKAQSVFDVSGAGDTVIAVLALCAANNTDIDTAIKLANAAAGIAVGKVGTATVSLNELKNAIEPKRLAQRILDVDAFERIAECRKKGEKIVFTNGCFDVLHKGHLHLLEEASKCGDRLIVGINSDASVKRNKGNNRPIQDQDTRAQLVASLKIVDAVIVFDELTPFDLISKLQPDVLVKGADYEEVDIIGREFAKEVVRVKLIPNISTTNIIKVNG